MPEINRVPFKYDPIDGGLYVDSFRQQYHMERLDDVTDTLQYCCFAFDTVRDIEGTVRFSTAADEPPKITASRYSNHADRVDYGMPFAAGSVTLWPDD